MLRRMGAGNGNVWHGDEFVVALLNTSAVMIDSSKLWFSVQHTPDLSIYDSRTASIISQHNNPS